jgi:hypothetical protein
MLRKRWVGYEGGRVDRERWTGVIRECIGVGWGWEVCG